MALQCPDPAALFISTINSSQLQPFDNKRAPSFGVWSLRTHSKRRRRGVRRLLTQVSASAERENHARSSSDGDKKEIRLNSLDLMALEFGRLLGESKEKTVSKVVRKKIDPGATYIGIEKQVKGEKTSILKQVMIQSPKRAPRNGVIRGNDFTSTSSLPALSSPPMRQKGSPIDFPQNFTRPELKLGKEETVDEALLRRPLDQNPSKKSQGKDQPISEQNESMEMSKIRFQRLLQGSLETGSLDGSLASSTTSLPDVSSGSSKNKKEIQVKLSSPVRPRLVSEEVINAEGRRSQGNVSFGIPNLASPPSRQKGSAGMFSTTPQVGSRAPTEIPIDEGMDDSFLRKPTLIQPQEATISLDTNSSVDGAKDVEVSVKKSNLDEAELNEFNLPTVQIERFPNLASPPSRRKSSAGMFYASPQDKVRVLTTNSADAADDSLIEKPTLGQSQEDTGPLETRSSYQASSNKMKDSKLAEANVNDVQLKKPTDVDDVLIDEKQNKLDEDDFNEFILPDEQTRSAPSLASPPSRQNGSAGMFSTTFHARSRTVAKNSVDESVGDSFLRKPTLSEPQQTTATLKTSSLYVPSSNNMKNPELRDRNVNDDDLLHRGTNVDDIKINEQKTNLNEDVSNECESSNKTTFAEAKLTNRNDSVKMFDEKSLAEEAGTSQEEKLLVEFSIQMKLMKPKLPNNLKMQPSQVDIKAGNPDFIPEIEDMNSQIISSLRPEPYIQSKVANVEQKITNKTKLETDVGLFLGQVEEASEILVQTSPAIESQEISSGNRENKQDIEKGFSRNQVSTEPGSALPKQLGESTERLRKPLQLNNLQLSKQKDKEMLSLLAKQEDEEREWARADALLKSKEQVEVKLIGSNSAGLFASFGCLVGFLPSFELSQKRGLIDFSTWAQQKGIDFRRKAQAISSGITDVEVSQNDVVMEVDLKELRRMYTEEILKLISNFIGEKTKVVVKQVDKNTRRLKFSEREADPDSRGLIQKKAELMAELKVGDVVTCEVKSITPIGVFVELEGVAALIHHSEVSWNKNIDASSLLSIGEIIKARVCRLDRNLQRINLSLKQMQPDPLTLTLESVVGDAENDVLRDLEVTESEAALWPELEDLIKELKRTEEISSVSKGRCLRSAALAPTFQVLLSTPQSDGYKLLARFGNEIQEVVVKTTLDREKMKECIRLYTFT